MSEVLPSPKARHPLAVLGERTFALYAFSAFSGGTASAMLQSAILWHVYEVTGSALQLGIVGFVRFAASLSMALISGAIADSYDRRRVILLAQLIPLSCAATLFIATRADVIGLPLIYALVFLIALSTVLQGPARQALLPSIVPRTRLPKAITISSSAGSLARISGPAGAGFLIGWATVTGAYAVSGGLILASMLALLLLRARPVATEQRRGVNLAAIREGVGFVWHRQVLVGVMALDLFCVVFGGAMALLPIFATDILDVGPRGFGLLSASIEIGAVLMSAVLIFLPQIDRAGRALFISVLAFGLATIIFGLSQSFLLSLLAYMAVGMGDQASVVMRLTTIQMSTPPELLGPRQLRELSVRGIGE